MCFFKNHPRWDLSPPQPLEPLSHPVEVLAYSSGGEEFILFLPVLNY